MPFSGIFTPLSYCLLDTVAALENYTGNRFGGPGVTLAPLAC